MPMFKKITARTFMLALTFLLLANPAKAQSTHSADQNDDGTISFNELLRVIQLYHLGSLHCDSAGEDGFQPGVGDQSCQPYSGDYNPQDWIISFDELLRVIQLYNAGHYYSCPGVGEDGFCPDITITLPGGIPLEMVHIPAGNFQMGAYLGEQDSNSYERPQHTVTIAYTFQLGKFEVTQAQWLAVMGSFPYPQDTANPDVPVVWVSWNDCQTFLTTLNTLGLGHFRLPSEAEWEYACRAGTSTRFYWGDDPTYTDIDAYAWYAGNSGYVTHVVGGKLPNAWGLYDMNGNENEWCQDWWHWDYTDAPADGSAWESGGYGMYPVVRGGNWNFSETNIRSAYRAYRTPGFRFNNFGFRLLRVN